jgi:phospholipid transport system substrate-binding protein
MPISDNLPIHKYLIGMRENIMVSTWRLHGLLVPLLALGLLLGAKAGAASVPQAPEQLMTEVSKRLIDTLKAERGAVRERPQHMFDLVDQVLGPHVDFNRMSGWVLGKYWRQASPEQRQRFIGAFRVMMVRFYTAALLEDPTQLDQLLARNDNLITFLPGRPAEGDTTTVRSEVHLEDGKVVQVLFAVHNRDGDWKVYDVTVEGVSLVTNYRTSFAQEITQVGIDGLITRLEERNQALMDQVVNGKKAAK